MAVSWVHEVWNTGGEIDEEGVRNYTRGFQVKTDSALDGPLTVIFAPNIPRVGHYYVEANGAVDVGARCVSVTPERNREDPQFWDVICRYSSRFRVELADAGNPFGDTPGGGGDFDTRADNPLNRGYEISWSSTLYRRVVRKGILLNDNDNGFANNGTLEPIQSSSKEPFDPAPEDDEPLMVLSVTRNEAMTQFDPIVKLRSFINSVNDDIWYGVPRWEARCASITAQRRRENEILYWAVTYVFELKEGGWIEEYLDQGYKQLINIGPAQLQVDIIDPRTGSLPTSPVLLAGNGAVLPLGTGTPVYRRYLVKRRKIFAELGL